MYEIVNHISIDNFIKCLNEIILNGKNINLITNYDCRTKVNRVS